MHGMGVEYRPAPMDIVLPVGISFYTFETLSYTLDVYRKHGLFLVAERTLSQRFAGSTWTSRAPARVAFGTITFVLVCIAWVFFCAKDLPQSAMVLASMVGAIPAPPVLSTANVVQVLLVTTCLLGSHIALRQRRLEDVARTLPAPVLTLAWSVMLWAIVLTQGGGDAFIYFQF